MHLLAKFAGINIAAGLKRGQSETQNQGKVLPLKYVLFSGEKIGFNWKDWFNYLGDAGSVPIAMPVTHQGITFPSPSTSIFPHSSPPCLLLSSQQPLSGSPQSL